ncbi:MAG: site-specific DNA-methyltransferase [Desulfobacteraceae bacterium 4572_87]|nr:MAG: site-specific DNA-methyltransferase [Desulfobacteraceae bacterium 4572_87]
MEEKELGLTLKAAGINSLFNILKIDKSDRFSLLRFARIIGISLKKLNYYENSKKMPSGVDLEKICEATGLSPTQIMLKLGIIDYNLKTLIENNSEKVFRIVESQINKEKPKASLPPPMAYESKSGTLYQGDCLELMPHIDSDSIDLIFADPPFNLNKIYPSNIDDNLKSDQYIKWCEEWAKQCIRILKPGGSIFVWNLPKWNTFMAAYLNTQLTFRHWISVDIKYSLPIRGRLYPSHYALLYYCKGEKPAKFHPDRLPMSVCPHCFGDLKDYGGYKDKMNPNGINMSDVWLDIPPVRHKKYKKRNGANELSVKLLDRIIEMSTDEGDTVFDPFGGSGTTYAVSEIKNRKWIGIEIGPVEDIINRFKNIEDDAENLNQIRKGINSLFPEKTLQRRIKNGLWTPESVNRKKQKYSTKSNY